MDRLKGTTMAWRIVGSYLASCSCNLICPCPVDGPPTSDDGQCRGFLVFSIKDGSLDDTDLSGVNVALYNLFPSNLTAGNWKVGLVIDEGASDEQTSALERIFKGEVGGPFGDMAPLFGEYLGTERDSVTYSDGDTPSASIGGSSEATFAPRRAPDGSPTTVKGAMFGFAPEYKIGTGSGKSDRFGLSFDPNYAEAADFEFASEQSEEAPAGRI
jgi:hypothetical protein